MRRLCAVLVSASLSLALAGCSTATSSSSISAPVAATNTNNAVRPTPSIAAHSTGVMHGGQQPISGSTIQLYAVGATSSTPLLAQPITSDKSGNFDLTGLYTCPAGDPLVYLSGTGGDAGGGTNSNIAMLTVLGRCSSISSGTYVVMNEISTVATIFGLSSYMTGYDHVAYGADATGIAAAFNNVTALVNPATGTPGGPSLPSGYGVSVEQINTLADIMASCINSSSSSSNCGSLYSAAGSGNVRNTVAAMLHVALNPTENLAALYSLIPPTSPFQPALPSVPGGGGFSVKPLPLAATPVLSLDGGNYKIGTKVTVTESTPGATLYYTINNSTPSLASPVLAGDYLLPDTTDGVTLCVIAAASGFSNSAPACTGYSTSTATPTFAQIGDHPASYGAGSSIFVYGDPGLSPANNLLLAGPVAITSPTPGATIYYTVNNTSDFQAATTASTKYTGAISGLIAGQYVSAVATAPGYGTSPNSYFAFFVQTPAPVLSAGGKFPNSTNVAVSEPQPGAVVFYTTDGSIPTTNTQNSVYDGGSIPVNTSEKIVAFASTLGTGYLPSNLTVQNYAIAPYSGVLERFAGNYSPGYSGDGAVATAARVSHPKGIAAGLHGEVYLADYDTSVIRVVTPDGLISTFAGTGTRGFSGDGGTATAAKLNLPSGLAMDSKGNLYIADYGNNCVRMIDPSKIITTVAGKCGAGNFGYAGDGGPATKALLNLPASVAIDSKDDLYITDSFNGLIRKVTDGVINPYAGNGAFIEGPYGDGGKALNAELSFPWYIAFDSKDNLYITDYYNQNVRMVTKAGIISTVAGSADYGEEATQANNFAPHPKAGDFKGDGGKATAALLNTPQGIAVDHNDNVYIADSANQRIRRIDATTGFISTVAGGGTWSDEGAPATVTQLNTPISIAFDPTGNLLFSDGYAVMTVAP